MLKKVFLILIFSFFIISCVSAEEIDGDSSNGTYVTSVDMDEIDNQYQCSNVEKEVSSSDKSLDEVVSSADVEEDSLTDEPGISTNRRFNELKEKLYWAPKGGTVYLDKDYYYHNGFYNSATVGNMGLSLYRSVVIEGNGHVIDGMSISHFDMSFSRQYNVSFTIKNVTFKNFVSLTYKVYSGYNIGAPAIEVSGVENFSFVNCNFVNLKCANEYYDFLIYNCNSASFINCTFVNCSSDRDGGAIASFDCNSSLFAGCSFINCSSSRWSGAILLVGSANSSFVDCSFINNSAEKSAGALLIYKSDNSSIINTTFEGNYARGTVTDRIVDIPTDEVGGYEQVSIGGYGGAVSVQDCNSSVVYSCSFNNNLASGGGGAIYILRVSDSKMKSSKFLNNSAYYAGTLFIEESNGILNNISVSDSSAFYFGGAMAFGSSDMIVNNTSFDNYQSLNGAGGAIYNYEGSAMIINSSFSGGKISRYGGAIANSQADLTILASNFIDNSANYGGAVYSVHGNVFVNGSFFRNSYSNEGGAVYCMMSNSLMITNNVFINNTGDKYNIYSLYSNRDFVESGNHFENLYHVMIEYRGVSNGRQFIQKSKVLHYVISNDGMLFGNYDNLDSGGDDGQLVTINLFNADCPNNSTIYGDYNDIFKTSFYFQRNYNIASEFKDYESINIYLYDDSGFKDNPEKISDLSSAFQISMNMSFANRTIFDYNDLIGFNGHYIAISLINSSRSDLDDFPEYYDGRDYGYVTPVRNQGDGGNCWAFAGLATLETCIKKATGLTYDFSENNPKNLMAMDSTMGLNMTTNGGGFDSVVIGYLTSWLGPISEKSDVYDDYSSLSPVLPSIFHVQNIYFLPPRQNNLDNALYKKAIMDYGAVAVSLKWSNGKNHAVSLVGWVDDYYDYDSLGNFAKHAWIVKNSWGSTWEDGGFGYITWDIPFLSDDPYSPYNAYTFIFDEYENYFKSYQYEYSGVNDFIESYGEIYYSTKFTCNENQDYDEGLVAFSTTFKDPTNFTVSVYLNDELVLTQDGYRDAGYYTIPFDKVIDIKNGDEFTIVVANHNPGFNFAPISHADETTVANVRPNTSMVSFDGVHWYDLYDIKEPLEYFFEAEDQVNTCQIACIKAFTSLYNAQVLRLDINEFNSLNINETITIDLSVHGNQFYFDTMEVTNNTLITLNINGKYYYSKISDGQASIDVRFDDTGIYTLSSAYENNLFSSNIVQFNFTVKKGTTVLSAKSLSKVYGGSENSIITLKDDKGNAIRNAWIVFSIKGKPTTFKTNDKGQISVPINLVPSTYTATVTYGGNKVYSGSSIKVSITVKKITPKLTASKKTFKAKKKTKKYAVTLKDNLGKAIKNTKVKLKVKGKTYTAKTNSKGKAVFKIKKLNKKGSLKATVKYGGNMYYKGVSKKVALKIK